MGKENRRAQEGREGSGVKSEQGDEGSARMGRCVHTHVGSELVALGRLPCGRPKLLGNDDRDVVRRGGIPGQLHAAVGGLHLARWGHHVR